MAFSGIPSQVGHSRLEVIDCWNFAKVLYYDFCKSGGLIYLSFLKALTLLELLLCSILCLGDEWLCKDLLKTFLLSVYPLEKSVTPQ